MPAARRLSALLAADAPVDDHLRHLAHLLAAFHARAGRSAAADLEAGVDATRRRWQDNTEALLRIDSLRGVGPGIEVIQGMADRYLDGRAKLFARRIDDGRAVDGHGDLLADDIFCLDDGPRVLDCIEFDDRLRLGDGLADIAFLAMDLEHLGHADLARRFLDAYREYRDDVWPASLAHHHIAYRAQVHAKVTAIRAGQLGDPTALDDAHDLLELANAHLEAARVRLVVVGGLPGTGKSTIARAVGRAFEAPVLHSDHIRKELAGLPAHQPAPAGFGEGLYTDAHTQSTYATLLERASIGLEMGETVVLDASWSSPEWRDRAGEVAERCHAELIELRCDRPEGCRQPSDGGPRHRWRARVGCHPRDRRGHGCRGALMARRIDDRHRSPDRRLDRRCRRPSGSAVEPVPVHVIATAAAPATPPPCLRPDPARG